MASTTTTTKPWSQRPDESAKAFAAFEVYRELGAKRTVPDAYRQSTGRPQAKQAGGSWNAWAKKYGWADRARAWDERQATTRTQAAVQETRRQGRKYAQIRDQVLQEGIERWRKRLRQSDIAADMPLTTQTVHRDGNTIVIEAVDPEVHRKAMVIASKAQERLLELIDRGMAIESAAAAEVANREAAARPVGEVTDAEKKIEAWRAEQRKRFLTLPSEPPDDLPSSPHGDQAAPG